MVPALLLIGCLRLLGLRRDTGLEWMRTPSGSPARAARLRAAAESIPLRHLDSRG